MFSSGESTNQLRSFWLLRAVAPAPRRRRYGPGVIQVLPQSGGVTREPPREFAQGLASLGKDQQVSWKGLATGTSPSVVGGSIRSDGLALSFEDYIFGWRSWNDRRKKDQVRDENPHGPHGSQGPRRLPDCPSSKKHQFDFQPRGEELCTREKGPLTPPPP